MVWKMMMFEEFQDGCLVLGNISYAISSNFGSRGYGLVDDV